MDSEFSGLSPCGVGKSKKRFGTFRDGGVWLSFTDREKAKANGIWFVYFFSVTLLFYNLH